VSKQRRERDEAMKKKLNDPDIQRWYRENEAKLNDPNFMPDYPVNERLPLIEESDTIYPTKSVSQDQYEAMAEFASLVSGIVNKQVDIGLTVREVAFINAFYNEGFSNEDISDALGIPLEQIGKYARDLKACVLDIKRKGLYKCAICGITKRIVDCYDRTLCIDCSDKKWEDEDA